MIERLSEPLAWSARTESTLLEPFTYVAATGGKQVRSHLIDAFNLWLNVPAPRVELISKVVSMLHNASLLIDDVEDNSQLRRGSPVAHKIYGVPLTINSANYVYFLAFQELFKLKVILKEDADLLPSKQIESIDQMVTEELLNLHRGQGLDVFWRDSLTCPTEEEYIQMVNGKTGGLLRIGIKLLMLSSKSEVDYVPLVNLIGIYFQIRDDYMNLQSTEYSDNKGYCEDLTEGKFSFPVVHSIRADESNRQVLNVLQKRPTTPTIKRHIVGYMDTATQSFAYTRSVLATLEKQAYAEVERLGGNKKLEKILERLHVNEETKAE
ncbi:isoprenoid synthase domain-containing protein [Cantharellus anzutake]|nr:isoprenoid synthase domain-containing protein [Cantharellus anzutake]KAF8328244.1 isoprenoid synthase domain-containing protein [Cantharellus anzutake]